MVFGVLFTHFIADPFNSKISYEIIFYISIQMPNTIFLVSQHMNRIWEYIFGVKISSAELNITSTEATTFFDTLREKKAAIEKLLTVEVETDEVKSGWWPKLCSYVKRFWSAVCWFCRRCTFRRTVQISTTRITFSEPRVIYFLGSVENAQKLVNQYIYIPYILN